MANASDQDIQFCELCHKIDHWVAYLTLPIDELRRDDSRVKDAGKHGNAT